ncbi:MAG: hypothetical protein ACRDTU_23805 [Micromonosporaceae bacterium]
MDSISFDFSDRTDLDYLRPPLVAVEAMTRELGVEFLIVGAAARDLLLRFGHEFPAGRATEDLDIAVAVADWETYHRVRSGFEHRRGDPVHRLRIGGMLVDLVPFGGVERPDRTIAWPPDDGSVMSAFGMAEALPHAVPVRVGPALLCKVASLPAQMVLKLTAWDERGAVKPRHDSTDIKLLLTAYSGTWNIDRLYEHTDLLEAYDFDVRLAGAALLGRDTARLLGLRGVQRLGPLVARTVGETGWLPEDMPGDGDENEALLVAYRRGMAPDQDGK